MEVAKRRRTLAPVCRYQDPQKGSTASLQAFSILGRQVRTGTDAQTHTRTKEKAYLNTSSQIYNFVHLNTEALGFHQKQPISSLTRYKDTCTCVHTYSITYTQRQAHTNASAALTTIGEMVPNSCICLETHFMSLNDTIRKSPKEFTSFNSYQK